MFSLNARRSSILGLSIAIPLCLVSSMSALALDEPNLKKEQQLFNIYKSFNQRPTGSESWKGAAAGKDKTYSVQKGDSLWDLSEALFGDSQFWPKIWSLNAEKITNPHEIFPSQTIHFTPGTLGEAPSMALSDKSEDTEDAVKITPAEAKADQELLSKVEIPPTEKKSVVGDIPGSLPNWLYGSQTPTVNFEVKKHERSFAAPEMNLAFFISDHHLTDVGEVAETELGLGAAAEYQFIFVRMKLPSEKQKLMVIRETTSLKDPYSGNIGYLNQIQGQVEILELVNSKENLYRAMVKKSLHHVEVGAKLIVGELPTFNNQKQILGSASARIVGGQTAEIFATQQLVFLTGKDLNLNETYPIFKTQRKHSESSNALENPRQIGEVKVVKMDGEFATAVVLGALEELRIGDSTSPSIFLK